MRLTVHEIEANNPLDAQLLSYDELTAKLREKVDKNDYDLDPDVSVRKIGEGIMPIQNAPKYRKTVDVWLELGEGNGQAHIDFQYVSFTENPNLPEVELELNTPMPSQRTFHDFSGVFSLSGEKEEGEGREGEKGREGYEALHEKERGKGGRDTPVIFNGTNCCWVFG